MRTTSTRQVTSLALWSGVLALTLLSPLSSSAADRNARVVSQPVLSWHKRFAAARTEARRRGVPLLVHFHASWCGPCRRMERDVLDTRQLASKLGSSVVAVKVDTDREPGVASRYRVRLLPTDLVLAPDGKQLARTSGYQGLRSYLAKMTPAVTTYLAAHPPRPATSSKSQPGSATAKKTPDARTPPRLGLSGYSPVTLWTRTKWQRGEHKFACRVGAVVYYLASAVELEQFRKDPLRYAPRCAGHDVVQQVEAGRQVAGSIRHAVFFDGGLYLFGDAVSLARFRRSPTRYAAAAARSAAVSTSASSP
jgi:thiol-disulfide isomerase/thioredoxin/YHS domain-containing protein